MIRSIALAPFILLAATAVAAADYESAMLSYDNDKFHAAFQQFKICADAGDVESQFMVGQMYAQGVGVPQSYIDADVWYSLASSAGNDRASQAKARLEQFMTEEEIAKATIATEAMSTEVMSIGHYNCD